MSVLVEPGNDHAAHHYPVTTRMQLGQCGIQAVAETPAQRATRIFRNIGDLAPGTASCRSRSACGDPHRLRIIHICEVGARCPGGLARACHRRLVADRGCAHIVNPDDSWPPCVYGSQPNCGKPAALAVGCDGRPPVQPKPALWSAGLSTMPPAVTGCRGGPVSPSNLDDVGFQGSGEGGPMYRITGLLVEGS